MLNSDHVSFVKLIVDAISEMFDNDEDTTVISGDNWCSGRHSEIEGHVLFFQQTVGLERTISLCQLETFA